MEQYSFSNSDIDLACEAVWKRLEAFKVERREAMRIKLAFEDVLLEYRNRFGEQSVYQLICRKRFSSMRIELVLKEQSFNPLEKDGESILTSHLLSRMGMAPSWCYKDGANKIVFMAKKKPVSQTTKMLVAILLSAIVGTLVYFAPEGVKNAISQQFLSPVTDLFLGLVTAIAGPLVFLSLLGSICSMENMETFGKIGKKTISSILISISLLGIVIMAIISLFYDIDLYGGSKFDVSVLLQLIYDIVPSNLLQPFLTGNVLQIIFLACLFGGAMLMLSSKAGAAFTAVEQAGLIVQTVMTTITEFLPHAVFIIFTNIIVGGKLEILADSWKMILIMILLSLVVFSLVVLWVSARQRVSPILLLKKIMPTFLIAFTTSSSAAAYSTNIKDSYEKLGIDKSVTAFGTPFGQAMFMPGVVVLMGTMQFTFAEIYDVEISALWIVAAYVTNVLLSFAAAPVAGGTVMYLPLALLRWAFPLRLWVLHWR